MFFREALDPFFKLDVYQAVYDIYPDIYYTDISITFHYLEKKVTIINRKVHKMIHLKLDDISSNRKNLTQFLQKEFEVFNV